MKPFVISSRAVALRVEKNQLVVDDYYNRARRAYPPRQLPFDLLVIVNSTGSLSFTAARFLLKHEVPILFVDWDGSPVGCMLPEHPINGSLQLAQLRCHTDSTKRRYVAERILDEKFSKSVEFSAHLSRYYPSVDSSTIVQEVRRPAPRGDSTLRGSLMTKEARVAVEYFRQLAKVVNELAPEFGFVARGQSCTSNNMSASDPFNVALNVAYGILECRVRVAVNASGLNESVGFLHEPQSGALSLVYDLMEPFRWVADYSLIRLLERGALSRSDFVVSQEYRGRMKGDAVTLIAQELSAILARVSRRGKSSMKYELALVDNPRRLVRYLTGASSGLTFESTLPPTETRLDADRRKDLQAMSSEERKALGIPKTTLWYIQRNLERGKQVRLYASTRRRMAAREPTPAA